MKPWDPPERELYPALDDLLGDWQASSSTTSTRSLLPAAMATAIFASSLLSPIPDHFGDRVSTTGEITLCVLNADLVRKWFVSHLRPA